MPDLDPRFRPLVIGLVLGTVISLFYVTPSTPTYALKMPYCDTNFVEPAIIAHSGYAYDAVTGEVLYDKNASSQLPLASLTKSMTVTTALSILAADAPVTIAAEALTPEGESGFARNEVWRADDLANFTMITSSNDGARALLLAAATEARMSEDDFIEAMNRRATALGLTETFFINETGLDVSSSTAGAYGSARDIAKLMAYLAIEEPGLIERSVEPAWEFVSLSGRRHLAENTSFLAASFASTLGSKTGFTDLAGGNMSLVFEPVPGRPVAVAVLGSTREGRIDDTRVIADHAARELRRSLLCDSLYD